MTDLKCMISVTNMICNMVQQNEFLSTLTYCKSNLRFDYVIAISGNECRKLRMLHQICFSLLSDLIDVSQKLQSHQILRVETFQKTQTLI